MVFRGWEQSVEVFRVYFEQVPVIADRATLLPFVQRVIQCYHACLDQGLEISNAGRTRMLKTKA